MTEVNNVAYFSQIEEVDLYMEFAWLDGPRSRTSPSTSPRTFILCVVVVDDNWGGLHGNSELA